MTAASGAGSRDVHVVAVGQVRFGTHPDQGIKELAAGAVRSLLRDAPLPQERIEAAWMSNAGWGIATGQHCIRGQVALSPLGIGGIPIMNVENACAGGASAFHGAFLGVASGAYDVALAIGAEQSFVPAGADAEAKRKGFESFLAGTDVEVTREAIRRVREEAEAKRRALEREGRLEPGAGGGPRSPFMDLYARAARAHMERYGTTQRQLAAIAAKNHVHVFETPPATRR